MSIRSSTVLYRSAAVMSRSGSVDRRSIVRHRIGARFSFINLDASQFYHLTQIEMNRGRNRDCVKPQLHCHDFDHDGATTHPDLSSRDASA